MLSKPLPDWLEARVVDMATELNLPVKVMILSFEYIYVSVYVLLYPFMSVRSCFFLSLFSSMSSKIGSNPLCCSVSKT